jgi:hypothetical protein
MIRTTPRLISWCAVVAVGAALVLGARADDTVRCRSGRLVNVGMSADQVTALCGEPQSRVVEDVPIRAPSAAGGTRVIGTTRVERWTYERQWGQFDALLSFDDGKLVRIELLTGR